MVGLARPRDGRVLFDGKEISALRGAARRRERRTGHIQLVFQDPLRVLDPDLTVGDIVGEGLRIRGGLSTDEIAARVEDALAKVGLGAALRPRQPGQISGGQRQRVSIARALAADPKLLLCDEPVSALDASNRNYILRLLAGLRDSLGLPIVIISHDLSSLAGIADRVVVLYRGRIVEDGPVDQVFTRPRAPVHRPADGVRSPGRRPRGEAPWRKPGRRERPGALGPPAPPHHRRSRAAAAPDRASSPPVAPSRSKPAPSSRRLRRCRPGPSGRWIAACHRHEEWPALASERSAAAVPR